MALLNFLIYLACSLGLMIGFILIYWKSTPYDDFRLMREGNSAVAICLAGALVGFTIPLSMSLVQSESLNDLLQWGVISMAVQLVAYWIMYWAFAKGHVERGSVPIAVTMAGMSIAIGLANAASQTY